MKIAVLGLGIIGAAWAKNLKADGLDVRVWNRSPKPEFADAASTVEEAVTGAEYVFVVVADPAAVEAVLEPAIKVLGPGQTVVQSSTISPAWSKRFAAEVEKTGASFLEAPFTGSKPAAEARQTVFYLGGEPELVEQAEEVLKRISKTRLHIGPLGSASALKLAMNLNIAAVSFALSESLALARASGLSDDIYFQALEQNVARSGVADLKQAKLREGDYAPQFSVKHMGKDLRLALETAQSAGVELPQTTLLKSVYDRGIASDLGDDDFIGLIRLIEDNAWG